MTQSLYYVFNGKEAAGWEAEQAWDWTVFQATGVGFSWPGPGPGVT